MKKILLLILSLLMFFACTNNTSIEEDKEAQISRLLKEADKKREETVETEKIATNEKGEGVVVEEVPVENNKKSHKGMSRGEIMEYEMTRVSEEMNTLQTNVQQYQEKKAQLKAYQEKLQNLEKLNNAGMK